MQSQLHIPQGIRFQCTACGHCCHEYPVPLTEDDVKRLKEVEGAEAERSISRLSEAERSQSGLAAFSYSLDKPAGGRCAFLTEEKSCRVHDTAKPAMCKLFPYTFMHCPDALKVGVSFASTGVLLNSGRLLAEEEEMLGNLGTLFEAMHPRLAEERIDKWARAELVGGALLDYADFKEFEAPYLARLEKLIFAHAQNPESEKPGAVGQLRDTAQAVLSNMFDVLAGSMPDQMQYPLSKRFAHLSGAKLDYYVLMPLYRAFLLGNDAVREDEIASAVTTYLHNQERDLFFKAGENKISFADLADIEIPALSGAEQDLINRFVYVKLFTRLYFGPGFSMMPLLSGTFHLAAIVALIKIALKVDSLKPAQTDQAFDPAKRFERLLSLIREVERRLTALVYSRNTSSMFELFALDPQRVRRMMVIAN